MKHPLLALSLLTTSITAPQLQGSERSCCEEEISCCGNPCYKPAFYCLENDCGFFVDLEFLYWYAKETNLPYAVQVLAKIPGNNFGSPENIVFAQCGFDVGAEWDYGARLGFGWQDHCDGWDGSLYWTYYQNCASDRAKTPQFSGTMPLEAGQSGLLNPFPQRSVTETPFFDFMSAKWNLQFNQIDLELGRKYLISSCFAMRPYAGLRGAWTKTTFRVKGQTGPKDLSELETDYVQNSKDKYTNRIFGIGLLAGFQPTWYFFPCVALYGNFSASLIWGEHEEKKEESFLQKLQDTDLDRELIFVNTFNRFLEQSDKMSAIVDLAIGLRWENTWCCNRYMTTLDLGWEHHNWFGHSYRLRTYDRPSDAAQFNQFDLQMSDLGYGGFVLRFRFAF